jgi:hypothetical protein
MDARRDAATEARPSPAWSLMSALGSACAIIGILGTWSFVALRGTFFQMGFTKGNEWIHESPALIYYALEGLLLLALVLRCAAWAGHTGLWLPPEQRRTITRTRAGVARGCSLGFAWFASILAATLLMNNAFVTLSTRVVHLESSGPFTEAALLARGRAGLHLDLYARERAGGDFELVTSIPKSQDCAWPFEVRPSANREAYLVVDARKLVVAMVNLELREIIARPERMPSLDQLRIEFGSGLDGHSWTDDE